MTDWFASALARFPRLAIAGGPRTGKTTLVERVADRPVVHTDDFMSLEWSLASAAVRDKLQGLPSFIVEGVRAPHVLRKGLVVDAAIWLDQPLVHTTYKQNTMARAILTVFQEWRRAHPEIEIIIPAPVHARDALPKQEWPKPLHKHDLKCNRGCDE